METGPGGILLCQAEEPHKFISLVVSFESTDARFCEELIQTSLA
ncbi:MAG: hypothetical protein AAGE80_10670 [Pseudomonadota bacterium]